MRVAFWLFSQLLILLLLNSTIIVVNLSRHLRNVNYKNCSFCEHPISEKAKFTNTFNKNLANRCVRVSSKMSKTKSPMLFIGRRR
jgi:hypothetical protein